MKKLIFLLFLLSSTHTWAQEQAQSTSDFSNESEASVVVSGGNTEIEVYNFETENTYTWEENEVKAGGHYTYGTSSGVLSARNWDLNARYDRSLSKMTGLFTAYEYEEDKFRGLNFRQNADLGFLFKSIRSDKQKLDFETGYRFSKEKNLKDITNELHKSRYAFSYQYKSDRAWSFKIKSELLLNHTDKSDTIFNAEPSFNVSLSDIVSFKITYKAIYDNQPNEGVDKKYDYQVTSGLIAKF
jgi:putative salt-induced outer membrane protein YdiY